jgi:hypothetical protein
MSLPFSVGAPHDLGNAEASGIVAVVLLGVLVTQRLAPRARPTTRAKGLSSATSRSSVSSAR